MSECIVLQIGQCGNQIGSRLWNKILQEQSVYNTSGVYNESIGTFFSNQDKCGRITCSARNDKLYSLKARGIMIDMEPSVVNQVLKSSIKDIFSEHQYISSDSGSGNNWAVGYIKYGSLYKEEILDGIRKEVEKCDALSSFFMIHSLGGGTGSGLGSYINEFLLEEFPEVYRFSTVICPSVDDDVVISPYNSILSLSSLINSSDCVLPIDNQSLYSIYNRIQSHHNLKTSILDQGDSLKKPKAFDTMNNIVANLLLNLTSSMRFDGSLNVDINDITTNLVPFPRLKFIVSSMTPVFTLADSKAPVKSVDAMFTEAFSKDAHLISVNPKNHTYLACALIARGKDIEISDIRRNIDRIRNGLKFAKWNQEAWKTGICAYPPINQASGLLSLSNNTCIAEVFDGMSLRFKKLYKRKANLHHYTEWIDVNAFDEAYDNVKSLIREYQAI